MIFVTVGTHEQQFNRLVKYVDDWKAENAITEHVIIQTGFSDYEPKNCEWSKLYPYQKMIEFVNEARIVITHGGPSSFIMPLQVGKIPIVVPRRKEFDEHVNDHQAEFCKAVAERQGNIMVVDRIEDLKESIARYDEMVSRLSAGMQSNNARFCEQFEKIVHELM